MSGLVEEPRIISVKELLQEKRISIPEYQRPYKWSLKNVNQLIDDIILHKTKPAYRLGTLVIHSKEEKGNNVLDIVDGQQRTITLTLIAYALYLHRKEELKKISKRQNPEDFKPSLAEQLTLKSNLSKENIKENYRDIERRIREFDLDTIHFFFYKCQLVKVVIEDISEAFQFFDSQNSRGKDLEPHDLLKAFHLREMSGQSTEEEKLRSVEGWESLETKELAILFRNYLFRIRNWSKGYSARYFTKNEVDVFKGVSPDIKENYPFADLYRIGHFYIEGYNQEYHRKIDRNVKSYPFQIDQVMINGKRFFELINYYKDLIKTIKSNGSTKEYLQQTDLNAIRILKVLEKYGGEKRTGDQYVRNLFDCSLIYYIDKFGAIEISRAIEKFFIWAYSLRLKLYAVQLASIDNHALGFPFIFKTMKEALHSSEVLNIPLARISENNSSKTKAIEDLFKEMRYFNG